MVKLILKYLKKYWFLAILAPIFMILEVLMDMVLNQYMQRMIDDGIQTSNLDNVLYLGGIMIGIVLIGVVCGVLSGVFTNLASFRSTNDMRKDIFKKIMNLSYNQTDKFSTGSLVTRVTNDITQVQNMISMALRMLVRSAAMFILGIVFTLNINIKFGIVLLIILPLEALILGIFAKVAFPLFGVIQKKLDRVNVVVHENVTGARVVKAYNKEDYEDKRFQATNNDFAATSIRVERMGALIMPLLMIFIYAAQVTIYSIGGTTIVDAFKGAIGITEMISVGQITQAVTYISMICFSIMMLGMLFIFIARASASAKRIREVLDCELEIIDGSYDTSKITEAGTVEFKNVSFSYPDANGNVLENINVKIKQGETIAIVGATGCGKSSLVNLITRFYDVSSGELLVDGVNVKDYKQADLRDRIAICLQKSEMFAGTIADNIRWGNSTANNDEVKEAATIAQAAEFIESKNDRYDEKVEEKGTSLSGGQKQRIAIARAIIKKPEIIIFDDSTSALDLVTEAKLYQSMREKINNITKIIVAQRVATAKNADKIIVLDGGTIIAIDKHENLLNNCKVYQDIYSSQLRTESVYDE